MNVRSKNKQIKYKKINDYLNAQLESGELCFTKKDALLAMDISEIAFLNSTLRQIKKGNLVKPFEGFYVIVTPENKKVGAPSPILFLDKMMKHLGLPYYLGLLSAAKYLGATHQAVMETQIFTTKALPIKKVGKHRIRFIVNKYTEKMPIQDLKTPQGPIKMSTPEATVFDLIRYPKKAGGFSHIATVLKEIMKSINPKKLAAVAEIYQNPPLTQRVGYLIDTQLKDISTNKLHQWLKNKSYGLIRFSGKRYGKEIERNSKWQIIRDIDIEADEI